MGQGMSDDQSGSGTGGGNVRPTSKTRRKRSQYADAPPVVSRTTKHPWNDVRAAYVEGIEDDGSTTLPSYRQLSERFHISESVIANRASKERWTSLRAKFQHEQGIERQKKRAATIANDAAKFDESGHKAATLGMTMVMKRLAEIAQESKDSEDRIKEARKRRNLGQPVEAWEVRSPIYYNELVALSGALEKFQTIGMRALGTDVQRHEVFGQVDSNNTHTINIGQELQRDDPDRMTGFLLGVQDAGIAQLVLGEGPIEGEVAKHLGDDGSDETQDGESVPDDGDGTSDQDTAEDQHEEEGGEEDAGTD